MRKRIIFVFAICVCCFFSVLFFMSCGRSVCSSDKDCLQGQFCTSNGTCLEGCSGDDVCRRGQICSPKGRCIDKIWDAQVTKEKVIQEEVIREKEAVQEEKGSQEALMQEPARKECQSGQIRTCLGKGSQFHGVGVCKAGKQTCLDEKWSTCVGQVLPGEEVCDGQDNDCDGEVDEGLTKVCSSNDVGACKKGVQTCKAGNWGKCEGRVEPNVEICNGKDDNCDGEVDENVTQACGTSTVGSCQEGTQTCKAGVWKDCVGAIEPTVEDCNGKDDDCDGQVDGNITRSCETNEKGACQQGTQTCQAGQWSTCIRNTTAAQEVPCNGKDDDCDGTVDEGSKCFVPSRLSLVKKEPFPMPLGHKHMIQIVSFSPDGKILASGSWDKDIKLWDGYTGQYLRTLSGHQHTVSSISWSSDGKTLASGSYDGTVKLWDIVTGKVLKSMTGDASKVHAVSFHPTKRTLASANEDKSIKLWDSNTGKLLDTWKGNTSYVLSLSWSPDGKTLASLSEDGVRLWDADTGKSRRTFQTSGSKIGHMSFRPNGSVIATVSWDKIIRLWDVSTGKVLKEFEKYPHNIRALVWSPDGKVLASAGFGTLIKLWDVKTGKDLTPLSMESGHFDSLRSLSWRPDGKVLVSGGNEKAIKWWEPKTGRKLKTISGYKYNMDVSFSPTTKTLAYFPSRTSLELWDMKKKVLLHNIEAGSIHRYPLGTWSPDGKLLALQDREWDGQKNKHWIKILDAKTAKILQSFETGSEKASTLSWSPDAKILASGGAEKVIKLWDVKTGKNTKTLTGHTLHVLFLSWSPDGKALVSASRSKNIRLWDISTGTLSKTLQVQVGKTSSLSWSPDSKTLASGHDNKMIRLWDASTGKLEKELTEGSGRIDSLLWAKQGKLLISLNVPPNTPQNATIKIWDPNTGSQLQTLPGLYRMQLFFLEASESLLAISGDHHLRQWK